MVIVFWVKPNTEHSDKKVSTIVFLNEKYHKTPTTYSVFFNKLLFQSFFINASKFFIQAPSVLPWWNIISLLFLNYCSFKLLAPISVPLSLGVLCWGKNFQLIIFGRIEFGSLRSEDPIVVGTPICRSACSSEHFYTICQCKELVWKNVGTYRRYQRYVSL